MMYSYVSTLFLEIRKWWTSCNHKLGYGMLAGFIILLNLPHLAISSELNQFQRCLLEMQETAGDGVTMDEARIQCTEKMNDTTTVESDQTEVTAQGQADAYDRRVEITEQNVLKQYTLMAHKPNYFLIASKNFSGVNPDPYREQYNDPTLETDDTEAKFQLSIKFPLAVNLFKERLDIYAAYTNRSFWQIYNEESAPFRETNHEPEIWLQNRQDWKLFGLRNSVNALGFVHQSNGRGGYLSRSWNRIFVNFIFDRGNWAMSIRPWIRINESSEEDDNPDITDYLGHGDLQTAYKWRKNTFSLMLRNILASGFENGTVEVAWSFPLWKYRFLKGYIQYFNGYGESLIDYNQHSNSLGFGVLVTDWL
jgi:phospholipase A1